MDISGMITGILPYLSYIVDLFNKLLEILSSFLGIDISLPVSGGDDTNEDAEG